MSYAPTVNDRLRRQGHAERQGFPWPLSCAAHPFSSDPRSGHRLVPVGVHARFVRTRYAATRRHAEGFRILPTPRRTTAAPDPHAVARRVAVFALAFQRTGLGSYRRAMRNALDMARYDRHDRNPRTDLRDTARHPRDTGRHDAEAFARGREITEEVAA